MANRRSWPKLLLGLAILLFLGTSCVPVKNLKEGEYLIFNQSIKKNKYIEGEELEVFYRQKPNRKIIYLPMMPYLYAYNIGKKRFDKTKSKDSLRLEETIVKYDTKIRELQFQLDSVEVNGIDKKEEELTKDSTKILKDIRALLRKKEEKVLKLENKLKNGNWMMSSIGEPPSIYNHDISEYTQEQMEKYLQSRGYFDGKVSITLDTLEEKLINVEYIVEEGKPYRIRNLFYHIPDTAILEVLGNNFKKAALEEGDIYNEKNIEKERIRITRVLQDNGYYEFRQSYVFFEVNDTLSQNFVDIDVTIKNDANKGGHKKFMIDEVVFETDVDVNTSRGENISYYKDIEYIEGESSYSKKVLDRKIFIRPGEPYSLTNVENTQVSLARLDIFKFVNINFDTTGGHIKASIFTSPYPKYQYSLEGGLNVFQSLPGPFVSLSLIDRNVFKGCEILELSVRAAVDVQRGTQEGQSLDSQEYGANLSLSFPRIIFPMRSHTKRKLFRKIPITKLSGGWAYIDRPEYTRVNLKSAVSYQWRTNRNGLFNFSPFDLGVVNTKEISDEFRERLDELEQQGSTLKNSFDSSLVSNLNAYYLYTDNIFGFQQRKSKFYKVYVESGGTFFGLYNQTGLIDEQGSILDLRYFRYIKGDFDNRFGVPVGKSGQLATRFHVGVARPYGTTPGMPYEKYFFTGGSNSNRAWPARRLGPGSFSSTDTLDNGNQRFRFEQPGEIILEANLELRRDLFSFFEGALFLDATNIWTLKDDPARPGSGFSKSFWREIALGGGLGIRLNFDFLLVRLDAGVKLMDPSESLGERWVGDEFSFKNIFSTQGDVIYNIGIGYPF
ncbi:POTRA domain-containing protein [Flammeovirgaceae bacterium SG7u.111]|nr:POTRA domain-containing protein [Flammeovirgaceae bacterium SG7u.111]